MKRHGRGRRVRKNAGIMSITRKGVFSGLNPKVWMEVVPFAGGAVVSELATMFASKFIPMTSGGLGNILLGGAMSGVTGMLSGSMLKNKALGTKMFLGGVAGVLGKTVANIRSMGIKGALGLHGMGYDSAFHSTFGNSFMGLNDFVSPPQITNSVQSGATVAQYSLPHANAQYMPVAPQMQAPAGAQSMADYEGSAVGAMLDQTSGAF